MAKKKNSPTIATCGMDKDYQAREDLRVLQQATDIQNDPARLKRCMAMAEKELKGIMNVMPGQMQARKKKLLAKMM